MSRNILPIYQEDTKHAFLDGIADKTNRNILLSCFRSSFPFENSSGKDLSAFTEEELRPVMTKIFNTKIRRKSRVTVVSLLSQYFDWCVHHGVSGAIEHDMSVFRSGDILSDEMMIFSPGHLQQFLDKIFDPESDQTIDNLYRCYYWMAYAGLSVEDTIRLKPENFDLENLEVEINGDAGVLYRQGLACIRNCISLLQFRYRHPLYASNTEVFKDRIPGDYIFRGIKGNFDDPTAALAGFRIAIARHNTQSGISLNYKRVLYSGIFYRAYEYEVEYGKPPLFTQIVGDHPIGKRIVSTEKSSAKRKLNVYASNMQNDYEIWKAKRKQR